MRRHLLHNTILIAFCLALVACGGGGGGGSAINNSSTPTNPPPASNESTLASLAVSTGSLTPDFDAATLTYSHQTDQDSLTVTPTAADTDATILVNGVTVASGSASVPIGLSVGENAISVVVTAEDGVTQRTYTISVNRQQPASSEAGLAGFILYCCTFTPAFDTGTLNYSAETRQESAIVRPYAMSTTQTITVNGITVAESSDSPPIALSIGANTIVIVVTAEDGVTQRTYTISVNRLPPFSNDATLAALTLSTGALAPEFDAETLTYSHQTDQESLTVTPTANDANAEILVNGITVASGSASGPIGLSVGENRILVNVNAEEPGTQRTYVISVNRVIPSESDATLASLTVSTGTLLPAFDAATTSYSLSVSETQSSMTITPTATTAAATIAVNGVPLASGSESFPIPISDGDNTITVLVTAEDGVVQTLYTLSIIRLSNDAGLVDLQVSLGSLSPTFNTAITEYTLEVLNETDSLTVTPVARDANATILVNDSPLASGSTSPPIALSVGDNTISVFVTSEDGLATSTYNIVARRLSNDATLSSLTLLNTGLDQPFQSDQFYYTAPRFGYLETTAHPRATTTSDGADAVATGHTSLAEGPNTILITVTSEDSTAQAVYTIEVTRAYASEWAERITQDAYLKPSYSGSNWRDEFGRSVAISGDTLVVGAPMERSASGGINGDEADDSAYSSGAVYVFVRDSNNIWSQQAYIKAPRPDSGDGFGSSVAVFGDTLVVGAPGEDSGCGNTITSNVNNYCLEDNSVSTAGAVYTYYRSGTNWFWGYYIKPSETVEYDNYGNAVALSDRFLAVRSYRTVYIYEKGSTAGAFGMPAYTLSGFGAGRQGSLALHQNTLVLGAFQEDAGNGAGYIYSHSTGRWEQEAHFPGTANSGMGYSAAVHGDTAAFGAYNSRKAYVYAKNEQGIWQVEPIFGGGEFKLLYGSYISRVALSGQTLVVSYEGERSNCTGINATCMGDPLDNHVYVGAAQLFTRGPLGTWNGNAVIMASNADGGDRFGTAVALEGNTLVLTAPFEDSLAYGVNGDEGNGDGDSGAAYVFTFR